MRLDKLLANMGYGSRKEIKKLCKNGAVKVDGKPVKDSSVHVDPDAQEVEIFGEVVHYREFVYLMMNKPQGVISATEDAVEETVVDLLAPEFFAFDVFPVGRLDKDTEGLLLLTNDGKLAHELIAEEACSQALLCTGRGTGDRRRPGGIPQRRHAGRRVQNAAGRAYDSYPGKRLGDRAYHL